MYAMLRNFRSDEDGAVTVDWVVLTAAIVGLSIAAIATVKSGVDNTAGKINHAVIEQEHGLTVP